MSKCPWQETPLSPAEKFFKNGIIAMSDATSRLSVDEETILSVVASLSRLPEHKTHIWFSEHLVLESLTLRASTSRASGKILNATIWFFVTVKGVKSRLPITCAILNQVPGLKLLTRDEPSSSGLVRRWLAQQCERVAIERYPEIVPARCDDEVECEFWKGEPEHDSIPVELVPNNDIIDFLIEGAAKNIDYWKALREVAKRLKAGGWPLDAPLKRRLEAAIDPANRPSGRTQLKSVRQSARNFGIAAALERLAQQGVPIWGPDRGPGPACEVVGNELFMSAHTILGIYKKDKELRL